MIGESIAAGLIANGLSSTFSIGSSIFLERIKQDDSSINERFNDILVEELASEVKKHPDAKDLDSKGFEIIFEIVNEQYNCRSVPDTERVLTTIADGLSNVFEGECSDAKTETIVDAAYDRAINRLIEDVAGTEMGETLLINELLDISESVSEIADTLENREPALVSRETYKKIDLQGEAVDNPLQTLLDHPSSTNHPEYVSRNEVPDCDASDWFLVVGRKGLGKTRTLAELTSRITANRDIMHAVSLKSSSTDTVHSITANDQSNNQRPCDRDWRSTPRPNGLKAHHRAVQRNLWWVAQNLGRDSPRRIVQVYRIALR